MTAAPRMTVEIWSDVICPFCYIGKRKFEGALAELPAELRNRIVVAWRSFQLSPDTRTDPSKNALQHLAQKKGWTLEFARQAAADITSRAAQVGLALNYDRTVVANTFDAHRLAHYAARQGKGDEMQEQLFKAYFVDGRNVDDRATLMSLATGIGLPEGDASNVLDSGQFSDEVNRDIEQAARFGINAVPCFVLNRQYAVSGAQDSTVMARALQEALADEVQG
jgi:predicted DsbA family dithiol-disulfide isomerase